MSATVTIKWRDKSNNETGFEIERCKGASCTGFIRIALVPANTTIYTDTGLEYRTTYRYRIRAINSRGKSSYSNILEVTTIADPNSIPDPTIPAAPTGVSCTAGDRKNTLGWNTVANAVYKIKRALVSGGPYSVIVSGLDTTSYTDSGLTNDVQYFYVVIATVQGIDSPNSAQVSGTPTAESIPVPPSTGALISPSFTSNGWACFPVVLRANKASSASGLKLGNFSSQIDIRNLHDDNSILLAILTAKITSPGQYSVTPNASAVGSFVPSIPKILCSIKIGTNTFNALCPTTLTGDTLLDGPLVQEKESGFIPFGGTTGAAGNLRCNFRVRSFNDGSHRVEVIVENCHNHIDTNSVTYDISVSINDQVQFTRTAKIHWSYARYSLLFDVNGYVAADYVPDFSEMQALGAVPYYLTSINERVRNTSGSNFDILEIGDLQWPQDLVGGREEIGPFPAWVAMYVAHKQKNQLDYLLKHGRNASGAWSIHYRDIDNTQYTLEDESTFWPNQDTERNGGLKNAARGVKYGSEIGAAHQASLNLIPYLLTGDKFFLEELQFWASNDICSWLWLRDSGSGLFIGQQTRAMAWAFRDIVHAAKFSFDSDPLKSYFTTLVNNNLASLSAFNATDKLIDPLGSVGHHSGDFGISMWMQSFLSWALSTGIKLGYTNTGVAELRTRIIQYQLNLLNKTGEGYDRLYAAPYQLHIYENLNPATPFSTYAELFNYNFSGNPPIISFLPIVDGYGLELRMQVLHAVALGLANAQSSLDFIMGLTSPSDSSVTLTTKANNTWPQFALDHVVV